LYFSGRRVGSAYHRLAWTSCASDSFSLSRRCSIIWLSKSPFCSLYASAVLVAGCCHTCTCEQTNRVLSTRPVPGTTNTYTSSGFLLEGEDASCSPLSPFFSEDYSPSVAVLSPIQVILLSLMRVPWAVLNRILYLLSIILNVLLQVN